MQLEKVEIKKHTKDFILFTMFYKSKSGFFGKLKDRSCDMYLQKSPPNALSSHFMFMNYTPKERIEKGLIKYVATGAILTHSYTIDNIKSLLLIELEDKL